MGWFGFGKAAAAAPPKAAPPAQPHAIDPIGLDDYDGFAANTPSMPAASSHSSENKLESNNTNHSRVSLSEKLESNTSHSRVSLSARLERKNSLSSSSGDEDDDDNISHDFSEDTNETEDTGSPLFDEKAYAHNVEDDDDDSDTEDGDGDAKKRLAAAFLEDMGEEDKVAKPAPLTPASSADDADDRPVGSSPGDDAISDDDDDEDDMDDEDDDINDDDEGSAGSGSSGGFADEIIQDLDYKLKGGGPKSFDGNASSTSFNLASNAAAFMKDMQGDDSEVDGEGSGVVTRPLTPSSSTDEHDDDADDQPALVGSLPVHDDIDDDDDSASGSSSHYDEPKQRTALHEANDTSEVKSQHSHINSTTQDASSSSLHQHDDAHSRNDNDNDESQSSSVSSQPQPPRPAHTGGPHYGERKLDTRRDIPEPGDDLDNDSDSGDEFGSEHEDEVEGDQDMNGEEGDDVTGDGSLSHEEDAPDPKGSAKQDSRRQSLDLIRDAADDGGQQSQQPDFQESGNTFAQSSQSMDLQASGNTFADTDDLRSRNQSIDLNESGNTFEDTDTLPLESKAPSDAFAEELDESDHSSQQDVDESEHSFADRSAEQEEFSVPVGEQLDDDSDHSSQINVGESGGDELDHSEVSHSEIKAMLDASDHSSESGNPSQDELDHSDRSSERNYGESGEGFEDQSDFSERSRGSKSSADDGQSEPEDTENEEFLGVDFSADEEFWDDSGSHEGSMEEEEEDPFLATLGEHLRNEESEEDESIFDIEERSCETSVADEKSRQIPQSILSVMSDDESEEDDEHMQESMRNLDALVEKGDWDGLINAAAEYGNGLENEDSYSGSSAGSDVDHDGVDEATSDNDGYSADERSHSDVSGHSKDASISGEVSASPKSPGSGSIASKGNESSGVGEFDTAPFIQVIEKNELSDNSEDDPLVQAQDDVDEQDSSVSPDVEKSPVDATVDEEASSGGDSLPTEIVQEVKSSKLSGFLDNASQKASATSKNPSSGSVTSKSSVSIFGMARRFLGRKPEENPVPQAPEAHDGVDENVDAPSSSPDVEKSPSDAGADQAQDDVNEDAPSSSPDVEKSPSDAGADQAQDDVDEDAPASSPGVEKAPSDAGVDQAQDDVDEEEDEDAPSISPGGDKSLSDAGVDQAPDDVDEYEDEDAPSISPGVEKSPSDAGVDQGQDDVNEEEDALSSSPGVEKSPSDAGVDEDESAGVGKFDAAPFVQDVKKSEQSDNFEDDPLAQEDVDEDESSTSPEYEKSPFGAGGVDEDESSAVGGLATDAQEVEGKMPYDSSDEENIQGDFEDDPLTQEDVSEDELSVSPDLGKSPFGADIDEDESSSGGSFDAGSFMQTLEASAPSESRSSQLALAQKMLQGDFEDDPLAQAQEDEDESSSSPGFEKSPFGAGADEDESSAVGGSAADALVQEVKGDIDEDESSGVGGFDTGSFNQDGKDNEPYNSSDEESTSFEASAPPESRSSQLALAQKLLQGDFEDDPLAQAQEDVDKDESSSSPDFDGYFDQKATIGDDRSTSRDDFDGSRDENNSQDASQSPSPGSSKPATGESKMDPSSDGNIVGPPQRVESDFSDGPTPGPTGIEGESNFTQQEKNDLPTVEAGHDEAGQSTQELHEEDQASEDDSEEEESESDEDSDEEDDTEFKMVVKEAPLLRLENVTSMTRSQIPVEKIKKNTGNQGGFFARFGFGGKKPTVSTPAPPTAPEKEEPPPIEAPDGDKVSAQSGSQASDTSDELPKSGSTTDVSAVRPALADRPQEALQETPPTDGDSVYGNESFSCELPQFNGSVNGSESVVSAFSDLDGKGDGSVSTKSTNVSGRMSVSTKSTNVSGKMSELQNGTVGTPKLSSPEAPALVAADTKSLNDSDNMDVTTPSPKALQMPTSKPLTEPRNASPVSSVAKFPQTEAKESTTVDASRPISTEPSSPGNSKNAVTTTPSITSPPAEPIEKLSKAAKKKKEKKEKKEKKKKSGLSSHLTSPGARKLNGYGDEVSVGIMDLDHKEKGQQNAAIKQLRPWEEALATKNDRKKKTNGLESVPEHMDEIERIHALRHAEMGFFHDETASEDKSSVDKGSLSSKFEADDEEEEEDNRADVETEKNAADPETEDAFPSEEGEGFADILAFGERESKMSESHHVEFDDMWDTVSCDGSTALDFERKKRNKIVQKKKKKKRTHQREKEREEKKGKEIIRLRPFKKEAQREETARRGRKKHSVLSSEFMSAIHRVFEDEEVLDEEDSLSENDGLEIADTPDGDMNHSCGSLYFSGVPGANTSGNEAGDDSENNSIKDDNDSDGDSPKRGSPKREVKRNHSTESDRSPKRGVNRNHSTESGRSLGSKSRKSKSSGSQRGSRKPKVNPHEIFEAELRKQQQGTKVLSISSLRQEMSDRRGTSVKLLQREFVERKKKRILAAAQNDNADDFDFAPRSSGDNFGEDVFDSGFGEEIPPPNKPELHDVQDIDNVLDGKEESQHQSRLEAHMSRWDTDESISELDDLKTIREDPEEHHGFFGQATEAFTHAQTNVTNTFQSTQANVTNTFQTTQANVTNTFQTTQTNLTNTFQANMPDMPSMPKMPSTMPSMPAKKKKPKPSEDPSSLGGLEEAPEMPFQATFNDMPMMTIREGFDHDDDNELGLLSSGADNWGEDGGGGGGGSKPSRNRDNGNSKFSFGKLIKLPKAPKLGIGKGLKSLMPKGRSGNLGSGGVESMDLFDDNDGNGLLG